MKPIFSLYKILPHIVILLGISSFFISCGNSSTDEDVNNIKKDTITTDETEMLEMDEVEMESMYEITNTKTNKTIIMSQAEYLESAIWENPDCIVKEIPMVK